MTSVLLYGGMGCWAIGFMVWLAVLMCCVSKPVNQPYPEAFVLLTKSLSVGLGLILVFYLFAVFAGLAS